MRYAKLWTGALLPLLPLVVGPPAPTGFIEASKSWDIDKDLDDGSGLEDSGSCSARVDFRADGTVRSVHTYDRTITRKYWTRYPNGRSIRTTTLNVVMTGKPFPYPVDGRLQPNLSPTEYEYQAVSRVTQHRDGTVTLVYRPRYSQIGTLQQELIWRMEGGRQLDSTVGKWRQVSEVCDPIEDFQRALAFNARARGERPLGRLPKLSGDGTAAVDMPVRGYPLGKASLAARWDLKP